MTTRANASPALEPSPEAVKAARERLRDRGLAATDEVVRDALRSVLAIEAARLDRRAREAAAACLLRIQEVTREALAVLVQPNSPTVQMSAVSAGAPRGRATPHPPPSPSPPPPPRRDQPVNLAEVVRSRLGEDLPPEPPSRPLAPPTPPPSPARQPEPRRPVFKRPRGR